MSQTSRALGYVLALTAALSLPLACSEPKHGPEAGSNTNWLRACTADEECNGQNLCRCGYCAPACDTDQSCAIDGAVCALPGTPPAGTLCQAVEGPGVAVCLPGCSAATPCAEDQVCVSGACVPVQPPAAPGCSEVTGPDSEVAASDAELELVTAINGFREQGTVDCGNGTVGPIPTLYVDFRLQCAARLHARDMVVSGYFEVVSPSGKRAVDWMSDAAYPARVWGASVANLPTAQEVAQYLVEFVGDPNCTNVVDAEFRAVGVGKYEDMWSVMYGSE